MADTSSPPVQTEVQSQEPPAGFIEAATDPPTEDEDEGVDTGSIQSSLASLSSSIIRGVTENGRTYAAYGKEEYGMPMDEAELDRIDMSHAKYYMLLEKRRYLAPIGNSPQKVADLGTGTGMWSIDFAEEHPSAEVVGIDIAPTQPQWVPPNCKFEIDDIEADWTWPEESFDFIFARDLLFSVRDWPRLIAQCYKHLKPGGWIEFQSIYGVLGCDDGTLPENGSFMQYDKYIREAAEKIGAPLDDPGRFKSWFESAGFTECTEKQFKIPSNVWPKDARLKLIGAFERENFYRGLEAMSLRVFQKGLGWRTEETTVFLAGVRKEIANVKYHPYYPFYVVYGRKPPTPPHPE